MAILKNDHSLQSLGFSQNEPQWVYEMVKKNDRTTKTPSDTLLGMK